MRLRNTKTGAVVSCSEETAARLGGEWESADEAVAPEVTAPPEEPPAEPTPEPEPAAEDAQRRGLRGLLSGSTEK